MKNDKNIDLGIPIKWITRKEAEKIWPTQQQIQAETEAFYTDRPGPWEKTQEKLDEDL